MARIEPARKTTFGAAPSGQTVDLYLLKNKNGVQVEISTFGATVVSLKVPDRAGKLDDVVLGYDTLDGYIADKRFLGATIGRYANRIAHARFTLDGKTCVLRKNNGENNLHGGVSGFNKAVWAAEELRSTDGPALELRHLSPDGNEGFPGNLRVRVVYTLTDRDELKIEYSAETDQATIVNLTNHSYFNLAGPGSTTILDHEMQIFAERFTPLNASMIPTGELRGVQNTPFDFRQPAQIGARIAAADEQLKLAKGFDHNFVLKRLPEDLISCAARASDPSTGRVLEVWTTEPGVQFYSGNFLDGTGIGKRGIAYPSRSAFCLETQHFPDSPNRPEFPSVVLNTGERYGSTTIYKFLTV